MPWKLKHFSRSSVTEKKNVHMITTLLALHQHLLAKRSSATSGAKPVLTPGPPGAMIIISTDPGIQYLSSEEML